MTLTYDLDLQTWPIYPSTWPPCQNSTLYVCPLSRESETVTQTHSRCKNYYTHYVRGVGCKNNQDKPLSTILKSFLWIHEGMKEWTINSLLLNPCEIFLRKSIIAVWTAVLGRLVSGMDCSSVGGLTDWRRDILPWEGVFGGGISNRLQIIITKHTSQ